MNKRQRKKQAKKYGVKGSDQLYVVTRKYPVATSWDIGTIVCISKTTAPLLNAPAYYKASDTSENPFTFYMYASQVRKINGKEKK